MTFERILREAQKLLRIKGLHENESGYIDTDVYSPTVVTPIVYYLIDGWIDSPKIKCRRNAVEENNKMTRGMMNMAATTWISM
ncbi:MAG: hypothetical protein HUJ76_00510 [Parasporobacterium sp.]|nr:hypothetical protein [Parasporobacterium sp.]